MSLYFVGWGQYFLGWGSSSPAPVIGGHFGGKKKREKEDHSYRENHEERLAQIRAAFAAVTDPAIRAELAVGIPVDVEALSRDKERVDRLLAAYRKQLDDDDEAAIILLLM